MRLVLDTHILIWLLEGDPQLSESKRNILSDPANEIFVSVASLWEIAIKFSIGKLALSKSLNDIVEEIDSSSSRFLTVGPQHAVAVSALPFHHRDPFDRIIIAQALVENISIITNDGVFADYGVSILK